MCCVYHVQGAYTGVCSQQHVPSYKNIIDKFKAKGIDSVICVAVNDPYTMNAWAEKLQAKDAVSDYCESYTFVSLFLHMWSENLYYLFWFCLSPFL